MTEKSKKNTGETPKKGNGKSILIVEDEKPLAHALELKFANQGYDVLIAADGEEALKAVGEKDFDIILLDIIMPNLDGFGFMEKLQGKTPVVVLSNLGQDEDKERAKKLGAVDYFVKANTPITEIIDKVSSVLT